MRAPGPVAEVAGVAVAAGARAQNRETLERRRRKVLADLEAHPEQRVAADVAGAPLTPGPGEPVSVMLAVRCRDGRIVSAELHIPRERFDAALFLDTLRRTTERPT